MTAVKEFNGLNGRVVSRKKLQEIATLANSQGQIHVVDRLNGVLSINKDAESFKVNISQPANDLIPEQDLPGLCGVPSYFNHEEIGLGKGVSPDEIYSYITELIIETIKVSGHLPWQMTWDKEMTIWDGKQAVNYQSKKPYRGINYWFTNFEVKINSNGQRELAPRDLTNPYFLTFNQIESNGGKLKKGAKGVRVFYFTKLYSHTEMLPSGKKLSIGTYNQKWFFQWLTKHKNQIKDLASGKYTVAQMASSYLPILKYYNIFHGKDVSGIKWAKYKGNENHDLPKKDRIDVAENIIKSMPNAPDIINKGNQPQYSPGFDHVLMPKIELFNSEQEYYSTLFHELVHSTGHNSRLKRDGFTPGVKETKKQYAFEELIAEMGAVFLCAESGILFSVINNSASYLKGWNNALVDKMGDDNRFFFRASSKSQAAVDFILDRDSEGVPAYRQLKIQKPKSPLKNKIPKLEKVTTPKKPRTRKSPKKPSTPKVNANGQYALMGTAERLAKDEVVKPQSTIANKAPVINGLTSVSKIEQNSELWNIPGETGKFLQDVERKPVESVAVVLSTPPGTGKTTSAYKWLNDFAQRDPSLFFSLEEHPSSKLFTDKRDKYLDGKAQANINAVGAIPDVETMHKWIDAHDVIVIDSWQKLIKQVGKIDFDEDLRKRHNGKIFIVIFQETTTGRAKGGSDKVFDGDIIVVGHKGDRFTDNYLYFDKNRYTRVDLDKIRYNIADHRAYDPTEDVGRNENTKTASASESNSWLVVQ